MTVLLLIISVPKVDRRPSDPINVIGEKRNNICESYKNTA